MYKYTHRNYSEKECYGNFDCKYILEDDWKMQYFCGYQKEHSLKTAVNAKPASQANQTVCRACIFLSFLSCVFKVVYMYIYSVLTLPTNAFS